MPYSDSVLADDSKLKTAIGELGVTTIDLHPIAAFLRAERANDSHSFKRLHWEGVEVNTNGSVNKSESDEVALRHASKVAAVDS